MTSNFTPTLHRNCPGKGLQQTLYCHIQIVFSVLTLQSLKNLEGVLLHTFLPLLPSHSPSLVSLPL